MGLHNIIALVSLALFELGTLAQNSPQDYLAVHNAARAEVGVPPLSWNATIAAFSKKYANSSPTCLSGHSVGGYAENIAAGYGNFSGVDAVKYWLTEKEFYDPKTNTCIGGEECGHYQNIIASLTTDVGCATVKCLYEGKRDWQLTVCDYWALLV